MDIREWENFKINIELTIYFYLSISISIYPNFYTYSIVISLYYVCFIIILFHSHTSMSVPYLFYNFFFQYVCAVLILKIPHSSMFVLYLFYSFHSSMFVLYLFYSFLILVCLFFTYSVVFSFLYVHSKLTL